MAPDKDVLSNMFSSFVSRKTRACSPAPSPPMSLHQPSLTSPPPLVLLPPFNSNTTNSNSNSSNNDNHSSNAPAVPVPSVIAHPVQSSQHHLQQPHFPHHHPQYHHLNAADAPHPNEPLSLNTPRHARSRSSRVSSSRDSAHPSPTEFTVPGTAPAPFPSTAPVAFPTQTPHPGSSQSQEAGPSSNRATKRPSHMLNQNHFRCKNGSKSSSSDRQHKHQNGLKQQLQITVQNEEDIQADRRHNTGGASSSVHGGRGSAGSVEAIATDSTAAATPYHCDRCSKAFRQRSQLSRHFLRVHERKKPFGCAHCDKCFASAFDRKRHVEAVHGRRCIEFFCDRCSFRSKQEAELEQHIRTVHERDQCRLCGKMFKRAANLVAHERHYHSKASPS